MATGMSGVRMEGSSRDAGRVEEGWSKDREYQRMIAELNTKVWDLEQRLGAREEELSRKMEEIKQLKRDIGKVKANESRLESKVKELTPKCLELEQKLKYKEEDYERKMNEMIRDLYGIEGAVGGLTSTPMTNVGQQEWKQWFTRSWSQDPIPKKDGEMKGGVKGSKPERKGETIKKRLLSGKSEKSNSRYEEKYGSKDSLYSSSRSVCETGSDRTESDSGEEGSVNVRRSVLIREVPRISRFRLAGAQDIVEFFKEYERYCLEKLGENKKIWVKELGEFLDDRLEGVYRAIVGVGEPRYEVVKERVIAHVRRIKGGVKYRKRNYFEEARMEKGEKLETYAHRLESLARKKYGDENINENKELMRKFLATVPSSVRETVNAKRKDTKKWHNKRLMWWDILEMIEDREIDDTRSDREDREVMVGRDRPKSWHRKSYSDAVGGNTVEVMAKFLEEYEKDRQRRDEEGWTYVGRDRNRNRNVNDRRGWENNRGRMNEIVCIRCGKAGHRKKDCMLTNGACFGCGQVGHLVGNCPNPCNFKCFRCGEQGHRASECGRNGGRMNFVRLCGNCGQQGHFARMCKSPRSTCSSCGQMGHTAVVCRRGVGAPAAGPGVGGNRNVGQVGVGPGNLV